MTSWLRYLKLWWQNLNLPVWVGIPSSCSCPCACSSCCLFLFTSFFFVFSCCDIWWYFVCFFFSVFFCPLLISSSYLLSPPFSFCLMCFLRNVKRRATIGHVRDVSRCWIKVKMDKLGPLVINTDGSIARQGPDGSTSQRTDHPWSSWPFFWSMVFAENPWRSQHFFESKTTSFESLPSAETLGSHTVNDAVWPCPPGFDCVRLVPTYASQWTHFLTGMLFKD